MKIRRCLLLSVALCFTLLVSAQQYNTAAGVRFGDDLGLSVAQRISSKNTLQLVHEGGFTSNTKTTSFHFKHHKPLISKRLNFFTGIGAFARYTPTATDAVNPMAYGPAATLGLDFTVGRFNIAADWSPVYNVHAEADGKFSTSTGLTLRYVFVKRKTKFKKWREGVFKKKK